MFCIVPSDYQTAKFKKTSQKPAPAHRATFVALQYKLGHVELLCW